MTDTQTSAAAVDETVAATAGDDAETITFKGETFTTNPDVSDYAVIEFAQAVDDGLDTGTYAGLAALNRLVVECIAPDDRERFKAVARRSKATADDLFELLMGEVEADAERPTGLPVDSSIGQSSTPEKSAANSADRVSPLAGRPDLLMAVEDAVRRAA